MDFKITIPPKGNIIQAVVILICKKGFLGSVSNETSGVAVAHARRWAYCLGRRKPLAGLHGDRPTLKSRH